MTRTHYLLGLSQLHPEEPGRWPPGWMPREEVGMGFAPQRRWFGAARGTAGGGEEPPTQPAGIPRQTKATPNHRELVERFYFLTHIISV